MWAWNFHSMTDFLAVFKKSLQKTACYQPEAPCKVFLM